MYYSKYNVYAAKWTETSIDCYERGCRCEGCILNMSLETPCEMKRAVLELVRKFGVPPKESKYTENQQKIIDAILNGASSVPEIKADTGLTISMTEFNLRQLYDIAEEEGAVFRNRVKIYEYIKWVREHIND